MKKYFLFFIIYFLMPMIVFADSSCMEETVDSWCSGETCLANLQNSYNNWSLEGNTGKNCIRVIAKMQNGVKTYFDGKEPTKDYKCSNGNTPTAKLVSSGIKEEQTTECQNDLCYVPEIWSMDCNVTSSNVSINENGQITGTTETKDTGVKTYFIVLLLMVVLAYGILFVSKKKNLFKNI